MFQYRKFFAILILLALGKLNFSSIIRVDEKLPDSTTVKPPPPFSPNSSFESISYDLTINPNFEKSTFDGLLLLNVTTKSNVSNIVLNKEDYHVDVEILEINHTDFYVNQDEETLKLKFSKSLSEGKNYTIVMTFENLQIRDDMTGFYKTQTPDSKPVYLTNFHPSHARKVFPCFDDFSVKSGFILNVNVSSYKQVLANSGEDMSRGKKFTFKSIGNLSAHNFAFAILPKFMTVVDLWGDDRYIQAYTRFQMIRFSTYATYKVAHIADELSQIFGVEYPLDKVDVVVVPDYVPHEIANLGLMVIPEYFWLHDDNDPSTLRDLEITKSISGAVASMWLQNIVTPSNKDQAWVGEGLVKYYEYFVPQKSRVESDLVLQFIIDIQQKAMLEDSFNSTSEETKVGRAACIFRMLETFNGTKNFTEMVQTYVKNRAYQSASIEDLYEAFGREILPDWMDRTGYPMINVNSLETEVHLSAERFSVYGNRSVESRGWKIPLEILTVGSSPMQAELLHLNGSFTKLPNVINSSDLVIISRDRISGYYRVNYDEKTWNKIVKVLNSDSYKNISSVDRSAILDDMFNLARAGYLDYKILFEGLKYLKNETEYLPLKTAIDGLSYLLRIFEPKKNDEHYAKFLTLIGNIFKPIYKKLSMKRNNNTLLNPEICNFVCDIGDVRCHADMMNLFENSIQKKESIPGDLRLPVYCNALKFEHKQLYKKQYFEEMLKKLKEVSIPIEKLDILLALGCYHNFEKLERFLNDSMSGGFKKSGIYKAELVKVMESIYTSSLNKSEQLLSYLKNNYKELKSYFKGTREIVDILTKMSRTHQSDNMTKVLAEFKSSVEEGSLSGAIQETIERMGKEMQASRTIIQKLAVVLDDPDIDPSPPVPPSSSTVSTTSSSIPPETPTTSSTSTTSSTTVSSTSHSTITTSHSTSTPISSSTVTTTPSPPTSTLPSTSTTPDSTPTPISSSTASPSTSTLPSTTLSTSTENPNTSSNEPPSTATPVPTTTAIPPSSTTPLPTPTSTGSTVLKVIFGLVIFAIILLFGYFIFVKFLKVPY